jgi:hypothetical protein
MKGKNSILINIFGYLLEPCIEYLETFKDFFENFFQSLKIYIFSEENHRFCNSVKFFHTNFFGPVFTILSIQRSLLSTVGCCLILDCSIEGDHTVLVLMFWASERKSVTAWVLEYAGCTDRGPDSDWRCTSSSLNPCTLYKRFWTSLTCLTSSDYNPLTICSNPI